MARNTYTLDGIPLTDPDGRWFLEKNSGLRLIPAKRMANVSYPGVDGDSFLPGAPFLPGGVRIVMYVEGVDHEAFMTNMEFITALFSQRHKLLELRHDYKEDATVSRHAFVKFNASSDINIIGTGVKTATVEFIAEIPGVFWRSTIETIAPLKTATTTPTTVEVYSLEGGNAPVDDALIRVKGGFGTLTLEDFTTKSKLVVTTALTSTEYIIIDPKNWTARKVTTDTWVGGTNVDMSVTSNRGYGSQFIMEPSLSGERFVYRLTQSVTNPVGTPNVTIRAKKSYL